MTYVKALQAGHSSQGTSEPITPGPQTRRRTSTTVSLPPSFRIFPFPGAKCYDLLPTQDMSMFTMREFNFPCPNIIHVALKLLP